MLRVSSIDLEPNARVVVPFYPPAIRDRLDDGQTPPTPQIRLGARLRRCLKARARIAYPPAHRTRRDPYHKRDPVIGREPSVEDTVGHQLAHHQPDVLQLRRWQEIRQPVQGMARGRDDLGLGDEPQIDLSFHQKVAAYRPALRALCTLGHTSLHPAWLYSCSIGEKRGVYATLVASTSNFNYLMLD